MRAVLITTEWRGVFFGYLAEGQDATDRTLVNVSNAKMAIYWGTERGFMQLAHTGPTSSSKISAPANLPAIHGVTAVFDVTSEAEQAWLKA